MSVHKNISHYALKRKPSDSDLIRLIRKGDKRAFELLYGKYSRFHLLTCLRYVKSRYDAQDLLQEAYILIYRDLHQFDESKGNFSSWSNRVVINVCLQHLRKKKHFVELELDNVQQIAQVMTEDHEVMSEMSLKDLTQVITKLPNGYRTIFNMYVIDGFTHKEISDKLNISISTSKTQLMKARNLLQKQLLNLNHPLKKYYA